MKYQFHKKHLEAFFWILAIILLAFTNPEGSGHLSLCPLKNMGFNFCPGCGLGHSISWIFRGDIIASFHCHPLGIPALIILLVRSINLLRHDIHLSQKLI
ncbi:DUF2752 domain-containing protein [Marinilabilia salmonicolor]|uniref:DUF2752 domain-containing protein n=1 Tax=Marinilabilia salmonicolor TaxID=989 RepID=UPI000299D2A4|nr:DUF2752 domain-containing protein [Marinilabilia salmonicolor]